MRCIAGCFGVVLWLALVAPGAADEIVFRNGDRLSGHLVSLTGGKLRFDSKVAGKLEVDVTEVRSLTTDDPVEIHLAGGTVARERLVAGPPGSVRLESADLAERAEVPLDRNLEINPPVPKRWSGRVLAGASLQRGNAQTQSGNLEIEARRQVGKNRVRLTGGYAGARQKNQDTRNSKSTRRRTYAGLKYDSFLNDRIYWFAGSRAEKDGVAELALRVDTSGGLGVQWFSGDGFELYTEGGLNWVSERFSNDTENADFVGARVAWNLRKALGPAVAFFHSGSWVPSLEDGNDQLVETETGVRSNLTSYLFLETKVRWRWDASPAEGSERQDIDYIVGMGYDF